MKLLTSVMATALLLSALGAVSDSDFEDAKASEAAYCERLAAGAHSDYLDLKEVCRERY